MGSNTKYTTAITASATAMTMNVIFLLMGIRMAYSISMENGINRMESTTDSMQSHAPHSLYFWAFAYSPALYLFLVITASTIATTANGVQHSTAHTMAATRLVGGHSGAGACICCI